MSPKTLAVVAQKSAVFLPTADSYAGYMSIVNPDYYWSGEIPARLFSFHPLSTHSRSAANQHSCVIYCRAVTGWYPLNRAVKRPPILRLMCNMSSGICNISIFIMVNGLKKPFRPN